MSGFKDVVGHKNIIKYIQNAVTADAVSHAYILNGERGSGKKLLANLFAMSLQCENRDEDGDACGKCRSCRQAAGGNQPDIIRIMHEKPNTIGVGDIRTQVNDDIMIRPYSSKYKIYIIADADMMSVEAQNALLKTIEEPPEYAVIMLLTENAETLLPTIRSRCVMMKLRNIKDQLVKKYLMEQLEVPEKALRELIYNSIAHKDYSGPAIQMRIYDRSIELWNYGLLPKELTPADLLKKHSSYPRNHNIATVFYKAGFVESWGRGYKKIAEEFEHAKMPLPTIEETGGGVMAIIQRETMDKVIAKRGANVGDMSETNVGDMSEIKLTARQRLIVAIIHSNPSVSAKQMSEILSVTSRTIERDLSAMQKVGIIRHEGTDNAGVWVVLEGLSSMLKPK